MLLHERRIVVQDREFQELPLPAAAYIRNCAKKGGLV